MRLSRFTLVLLLLLASLAQAQSDPIPSILGLRDGEFHIINADGSQIPLGEGVKPMDSFGNQFLYSRSINFESSLYYFDGENGRLISEDFSPACPAQFSEDGNSIIYLADSQTAEPLVSGYTEHEVFQQTLSPTSSAESLGLLRLGLPGGGGGGPFYTNDWVYWDDVSVYPGIPQRFALTDYGIVHTASCLYAGLYLADLENPEPQPLSSLYNWDVSPDGTQVIGMEFEDETLRLLLVDLASQSSEVVYPFIEASSRRPKMVFQIHWAKTNDIYYTSAETVDSNYGLEGFDFNRELLPPYTSNVQIYRFDLESRSSELILELPNSWAIGRIASDERYLYFSVTPDGTSIAEAYSAGTLGIGDMESAKALIQPDIYRVPLTGGAAELLYEDVMEFFLLAPLE